MSAPVLSLPKGGGAVRGIGEKFGTNPVNGTGSLSIPIATSPGRSGFGPQLSLSYDSGSGNGPFGFGWSLALPAIVRKTDKGLPRYRDTEESDVFALSGLDDLVPALSRTGDEWVADETRRLVDGVEFAIRRYRPRIGSAFMRVERWSDRSDPGNVFWRTLSSSNVTTWYGRTANSRLVDPERPAHIFSWLICESYDDKGNVVRYDYKEEGSDGIEPSAAHERNRTPAGRGTNRYPKRIRYGNRAPYFPDGNPFLPLPGEWLFEIVFDYGEHDPAVPLANGEAVPWPVRMDPFSTFRAGFEIRTYRLCRRVLMFHHFEAELGGADYLVRSTDFSFAAEADAASSVPVFSMLQAVTHCGYVRQSGGTYLKESLPALELRYSQPVISTEVRDIAADSLQHLPVGVDGAHCKWLDLDGDGVAGILTEHAGALYYKPNSSPVSVSSDPAQSAPAAFDAGQLVAAQPSGQSWSGSPQRWMDLAGDGQLDRVDFSGAVPGFYERTSDGDWEPFKAFEALPEIDWSSPHLRLVDLTGDGFADILITEDDAFSWHPSLAESGFGEAEKVWQPLDEERGPRVLLADGTDAIVLGDMTGDGLPDLVRIRNGEVCYWPNLGHGRFGAKVTMDAAPWFEHPDSFDHTRVLLADIDGTGLTDIVYLRSDGVDVYFNLSGNRWSAPRRLQAFPPLDDVSAVDVVDLLGNGTACLVWSSPLADGVGRQMRYVDLMGGQKPHLLVQAVNNLGAETSVRYAPSTRFSLADKRAGRPWITRLPFPVHVVERVEVYDRIGGNRFVSRFAYHHGHYDGVEREFRGFGMVEQWDTEQIAVLQGGALRDAANVDESSNVPPVLTRTWFHTGVYLGRDRVSRFFAGLLDGSDPGEYYREPGSSDADAEALLLDDTVLPEGLTLEEEREACRALKGSTLRQEVFALDDSDRASHPFLVKEQNFTTRCVQPRGTNRHGVFLTHAREALTFHYERNPADPRVSHTLIFEVDDFGNVLKTASIGYGRRRPDPALSVEDQARQGELLATCAENGFTNAIDLADAYRTPAASESRSFELAGLSLAAGDARCRFADVLAAIDSAAQLPYESAPGAGLVQKRLIAHVRTLFRPDDMGASRGDPLALLGLGELQPLALRGEAYQLAFTPGLAAQLYGDRVTPGMLLDDGRYLHAAGDAGWWSPSGRVFFSAETTDDPGRELAHARGHFFAPHRFRDPFHRAEAETEIIVTYDTHDLFVRETRDALGNVAAAVYDYRALQPRLLIDVNGNQSAVAFDALSQVAGTAVMGKEGENAGDSLDGFAADLDEATVLATLTDPFDHAHAILQHATTRVVYDLFAYQRTRDDVQPQPAAVCAISRETHHADIAAGGDTALRLTLSYSDGFGREIQTKMQAAPGPLTADAAVVSPRWVGSGWTIFNNKGLQVRQYEPFFSTTHGYEFARAAGVSRVVFYDPLGRVAATLHPNHTWEKVVFDPWRVESWDVNDTVLIADPAADDAVGEHFRLLPENEYLPGWYEARATGAMGPEEQTAALSTAVHAATPSVAYSDSLGRTFLTVAHNRFVPPGASSGDPPTDVFVRTSIVHDIEGRQREVIDGLDRVVMRADYDMLGAAAHIVSMDAGERWSLADVSGQALYTWDSRSHRLRTSYDALRRPFEVALQEQEGPERTVRRIVYGESQPDAASRNLRGKPCETFDGAGTLTIDAYDFKGNSTQSRRQLAADYKNLPDWSNAVVLEADVFVSSTVFDALNRPVTLTVPDGSVFRPAYDEAGLIAAIDVNLRGDASGGQPIWTPFVVSIDYSAKAQREQITFANGVITTYEYDPLTFRLVRMITVRGNERVQDLAYTYDPKGNITRIGDQAQQPVFFRNTQVDASTTCVYDALYQLISADGREHLGQHGGAPNPPSAPEAFDMVHTGLIHPGDGAAMGRYVERYDYDAAGNILAMQHLGSDPAHPGWTRTYAYDETSATDSGVRSNRLSSTRVGAEAIERYAYDAHGNMTAMAHLPVMRWNYADQLEAVSAQVVNSGTPETTYYVYDSGGQRVRKVTERQAAGDATPTRMRERVYLASVERYREYAADGATVDLERETLHVMDGQQRVALVESRTQGNDGVPERQIRYQLGNHLGSASLELSDLGEVITYEEFYPYGGTSYQATATSLGGVSKRYRYTGKERDEESGLSYHVARYYAGWLGRWTASDPSGITTHVNPYAYVNGNPIRLWDPDGRAPYFGPPPTPYFSVDWQLGYWAGVGAQGADTVAALKQAVTNPGYTAFALSHHLGQAWRQGGPLAALNELNPINELADAGEKYYQAGMLQQPEETGRQAFRIVSAAASTFLIASGGAGAISKGTSTLSIPTGTMSLGVPTAEGALVLSPSVPLAVPAIDVAAGAPATAAGISLMAGGGDPPRRLPPVPPPIPAKKQPASKPRPEDDDLAELERQIAEMESAPVVAPTVSPLKAEARSIANSIPYKPTQGPKAMDWVKLEKMVADMKANEFKWQELISKGDFIRIGPGGEIYQGHHRVLAAALANKPIPPEAILRVPETARMPVTWDYTLR